MSLIRFRLIFFKRSSKSSRFPHSYRLHPPASLMRRCPQKRCTHASRSYTRASTYQIARAPTGLARCRGCKRRVEKGELRISIGAFVRPGRSCRLVRCCACIDAKFAHAVLAVYGAATRVPAGAGASAADVAAVRAQLETQAKAGLEPQRPASPSLRLALEGRREHEPAHCTFPSSEAPAHPPS